MVRHRLRLPRPVTSALAWQGPAAVAVGFPRTPLRHAVVYTLQMLSYFAHYEMPNDKPDELLRRLRVRYPIVVDRAIGLGEVPTVRLQRALGRPSEVLAHDTVLAWVHWSWFFFPHGTAAYFLLRYPDRLGRAATMIAATFDLGCIVYWVLPTAPPWWAGQTGETLPPVRRMMVEAGEKFWGERWAKLFTSLGGNPFAAMPSLHFGTSVTAAHLLAETGPIAGAFGWTYTAALGFALVYLGEHYVADLLAGAAVAEGVRRLEPSAGPLLARAGRRLEALGP
jgi:membrane-associated phospholipid phosphatase